MQQSTQQQGSNDSSSNGDNGNAQNGDDESSLTGVASENSLPAGQIIAILQEKPELVVELKQMLAEQLQQQGVQVQPDAITDEMLYNDISSNAELRANVTTFLRSRGYVSETDVHSVARSGSDSNGDSPDSVQTLQTLSQIPGTNSSGNGSTKAALLAEGVASGDANRESESGDTSQTTRRSTPGRSDTGIRTPEMKNSTDQPSVVRRKAPYNLPSMRDLYAQLPEPTAKLKRFGSDVFLNRNTGTNNSLGTTGNAAPLDIPIGPDYVVGPGDNLSITMWGGLSQNLKRVIDREGRITLPEAGAVEVAGLTLERTQGVIESALKQQYRSAQIAVTIDRLRTVRVYVVGDVQRPGAYDISSLSTPVNALFAAGGPTAVGSLRTLQHFRGKQLVGEIDLYDFLLHGVRTSEDRFQGGDTLLVPPAGPQVQVSGAVRRPAIYELKGETTLATLLADAGGATVAASLNHITVERIDANKQRETTTLDLPADSSPDVSRNAIAAFSIKDGDRIHVSPILPYSERAVYVEGHVVRPGRVSYHDGMRLSDVLHSYQDLLPEPAQQGEIVRLIAPDLHPETISFDVADALIGNNNLDLRPFDTIYIRGRYDADAPKVNIGGEVLRPGSYPLSQGMTAAQLVRMAGGFKRDALVEDADLASYQIVDGAKAITEHSSIRIGDAVNKSDRSADVVLKPRDVLTIHQITGWNDIGASIKVQGEVGHPGSYGFQEGERLSSVLRRAGGLRDTAYTKGAILTRVQVKQLEEQSRQDLIRQIETSSTAARLAPNLGGGDSSATLQLIQQQQQQALTRLRNQPASGRLVIHINEDINSWANTPDDIELRSGDVITIPKRPGFVLVSGQVYNVTAITYAPGRTAEWYLKRAGGSNDGANRKDIFIIRANGSVVGRHSGGWTDSKVLSTRLDAGDVVVVPQKIIGASLFWRNLLTTAQLASSIAITAAVAGL